jgi:Fic family protein
MLFRTPTLSDQELEVIRRIDEIRDALRYRFTDPRRWVGLLRRVTLARGIQGSNSIEGYNVSLDDAVAAAGGEEPLDAETEAWEAVTAYRDAMTYVLQLADDPHFAYDESLIRGLHYMMLKYDLDKSPGRWRPGPIYVRDERNQEIVYTGPDSILVPGLMRDFVEDLQANAAESLGMVQAAMAHLNLVMIHPFRDGNGRMARCMQTLVLAREGIIAPPFASIEEYLGANTDAYYQVLAEVGAGNWHPERDARPWLRFALTAHFRQAQTLVIRANEAESRWEYVSDLVSRRRLPERVAAPMFNAAQGFRLRNASYRSLADVDEALASRDLKALVEAGLLEAIGERRGRHYVASETVKAMELAIRLERKPLDDPFELVSATQPLGL